MAPPRVLLIGAYERDNFGDLLFLLQTEHYLQGVDTLAAAPIAADMRSLLDRHVPAYGPLLESEHFDGIWTVGGEVGATTLEGALRMSLDEASFEALAALPDDERDAAMRELCGSDRIDSPYMPRASAFPPNVGAAQVLNSVGIAGIAALPPVRQAELLAVVGEADRLAVRDGASSEFLAGQGVAHELVPDLVHTVALTRPRTRSADGPALVQVAAGYLEGWGAEAFGEALASAGLEDFTHVRLFLAGTAYGHDSASAYEQVAAAYRKASDGHPIEISGTRRPWSLVDEIAGAGLWMGLSLHGRIVSAAYGVPRVSFALPKVDAYARTWDPEMPFGVELDQLKDAVVEARSAADADLREVGADLAHLADDNITAFVRDVLDLPLVPRLTRRLNSVETVRRIEVADGKSALRELTARLDSATAANAELNAALDAVRSEAEQVRAEAAGLHASLAAVEHELRLIRASRTYRLVSKVSSIRSSVASRLARR